MLSSNGELVYKQLSLSLSYDFPVYSKHTHVLVWLKKTHVWNFLVSFQQKEILKFFRGFTTEHSLTEHEMNKYKDTYPLWTSLQITKRKKMIFDSSHQECNCSQQLRGCFSTYQSSIWYFSLHIILTFKENSILGRNNTF